jgi:hypothetical protein
VFAVSVDRGVTHILTETPHTYPVIRERGIINLLCGRVGEIELTLPEDTDETSVEY